MPNFTLKPNGDVSQSGTITPSPGPTYFDQLDEGVDTDDADSTTIAMLASSTIVFNLQDVDASWSSATTVKIRVRAKKGGSKAANTLTVKLSSGGSDLATSASTITVTATYATYEVTLTIVGTNTKAAWNAAQLSLTTGSGQSGSFVITATEAAGTYSAGAASSRLLNLRRRAVLG